MRIDLLDKLYPVYFCRKNRCKVVYGERPQEEYERVLDAKLKLKEIYKEANQGFNLGVVESATKEDLAKSKEEIEKEVLFDRKEEQFVDSIMKEINPKFSIVPSALYKTIVAITEPQHLKGNSLTFFNINNGLSRYRFTLENQV